MKRIYDALWLVVLLTGFAAWGLWERLHGRVPVYLWAARQGRA